MARVFELTTPLGKDVLLFRAMRGREELGRLSTFTLSALSANPDIRLGDLLGKNVTVKVELRGGGFRFFNGFVIRFAQAGMVGRFFQYRLIVRPWLWFLTRTADCRIFQDKTAPEIIKEVFADHPAALFDDDLTEKHARREYCVQYRETDFNFVSRLLEEEGMYYFFEHRDGRHVLKLVDSPAGHKTLETRATIAFFPPGRQVRVDDEFIHAWTFGQSIQPGVVAHDDYDFTRPRADLEARAQILQPHDEARHEIFDWPGEYDQAEEGEHLARARVEERHVRFDRAEAATNVRDIAVGRLFTLTGGPRRDQEREYLITGARYELRDNAFESSAEGPVSYECRFTALHTRRPFRAARITRRPAVRGPQTAVVTAPPGEEIFCDRFGRVKVVFHWDRAGKKKKDENTSCFLRVAQPWAGSRWGAIFLPRKGQEVLVDFLEGDPDRPIIVGSVYNADQMPPYELPANRTQSGIKTRSTLNGDPSNFNEIRFEDRKGGEQLIIHAERNLSTTVEADESRSVGHDRSTSIEHDDKQRVGAQSFLTVNGERREKIVQNSNLHVTGDLLTWVEGATYHTRTGILIEENQGHHAETVAGEHWLEAKRVVVTARSEIYLQVGGNFISISPEGIILEGTLVNLNCANPPSSSAPPPGSQCAMPRDPE